MAGDWLGPTASALLLASAMPVAAGQETSPADDQGRGVVHQLPADTEAFFATQHYTSTTLLHLRADGTFAQYDREHMFIAISDEGRWRQTTSGDVELCSHYRFEEIRQGSLTVYARPSDSAGLLPLAAAIEERLSAIPGTGDLAPRQLMPVVVRHWLSEDAFDPPPAGGLEPDVMSEEKRASRKDLRSLAGAIRNYVGARSGNLSTFVARRHGDLVWLSSDDSPLGPEIVQQYREHKEGPFLPGMVSVAVDAETFGSLLGTRQSFVHYPEMNVRIPRRALLSDFRKERVAEPQCGGFEAGTLALPAVPTATVTPVPAGEDIGFVTEGAGATLLVLGSDGRFVRYSRLENETKETDAGEWSRGDEGSLKLCSHRASFRPIERDRLNLAIDRTTYSKLPAFLSALQSHVRDRPKKESFDPKAVERIATRTLHSARPPAEGCSCRMLVYGNEPVPREELLEFNAELDRYLRSGAANLEQQRLFTFGSTAWLGDPAGDVNAAVIQTLRAFGGGPCVLPDVLVRIPMPTLLELRGPVPEHQEMRRPETAPLCAGFSGMAR